MGEGARTPKPKILLCQPNHGIPLMKVHTKLLFGENNLESARLFGDNRKNKLVYEITVMPKRRDRFAFYLQQHNVFNMLSVKIHNLLGCISKFRN